VTARQPWRAAGWRDRAEAWVRGALAGEGFATAGPMQEFRDRPWSSIWRIPTSRGDVYFKALIPALAHEVPLTLRLARLFPDHVIPVIAADEARAWMLTPDAGVRLRDVIRREDVEPTWAALLDESARIQLETIPMTDDFLAVGVPDRRLARLPGQMDAVQSLAERIAHVEPGVLTSPELSRFGEIRSLLIAQGERLAAVGLPESLEHDDLHDGNVLVRESRSVIFDWGDASIAHPFFTLRVSLGSIRESFRLDENDPLILALRDGFLRHWLDFGPMPRLIEAYQLSRPLSILPRILTWDLAMSMAGEGEQTAASEVALIKELLGSSFS
jgi:hypothetical protein